MNEPVLFPSPREAERAASFLYLDGEEFEFEPVTPPHEDQPLYRVRFESFVTHETEFVEEIHLAQFKPGQMRLFVNPQTALREAEDRQDPGTRSWAVPCRQGNRFIGYIGLYVRGVDLIPVN